MSLVPEIADVLRDEFPDKEIAVWAAGGIADGRGVAAALALGAEGAVMGTRVSSYLPCLLACSLVSNWT